MHTSAALHSMARRCPSKNYSTWETTWREDRTACYQLGHMDFLASQEELMPTLMQNRLKAWGDVGSAINPQQDCTLYRGIPQEVTDLILEYTLSKDEDLTLWAARNVKGISAHNFCLRNDHEREENEDLVPRGKVDDAPTCRETQPIFKDEWTGYDWVRPNCNYGANYSGWTVLQSCRRVYLDAERFLAKHREITIFEDNRPPLCCSSGNSNRRRWYCHDNFGRLLLQDHTHPSIQRIPSIHMYSNLRFLVSKDLFSPVSLTIHLPAPNKLLYCPVPSYAVEKEALPQAHVHLMARLLTTQTRT